MAARTQKLIQEFYQLLLRHFGPQHWWPAKTPFETAVGAILTQNTAWKNVERAIDNIRRRGLLEAHKLNELPQAKLAELIRPAGYFNIKAKRLKNFLKWLVENYEGKLETLAEMPLYQIREELLSVSGIGRETADSILLYALGKPVFVVDAYTVRMLRRHMLIDEQADYEQVRELFEESLPADVAMFNEYHALLVALGKNFCRPRPRCKGCPLEKHEHELEFT